MSSATSKSNDDLPEATIQSNLSRQSEEIEILQSMYDTDFQIEDETPTFSVTVNVADIHNDNDIDAANLTFDINAATEDEKRKLQRFFDREKWDSTLVVSYHLRYPSESPPIYHLSIPWLPGEKLELIYKTLDELYFSNEGEPIVYFWVEKLREILLEMKPEVEKELMSQASQAYQPPLRNKLLDFSIDLQDENDIEDSNDTFLEPLKKSGTKSSNIRGNESCKIPTSISIFTGEPLTDRKSTFQAHLAMVHSIEDVKAVLRKLYENKKIAEATHNMYAYRIEKDSSALVHIQDCEDDGETHAGGRLLHLLQILDCRNVVVVVTRWYGNILLHGDRFKHINNVARILLEKQGFIHKDKRQEQSTSTAANKHKTK